MNKQSKSSNLHSAKRAKNDEFYTQLEDIEKELKFYNFTDKTIYCNCDNPNMSNFYKYFKLNFHYLKINKLICTGYNPVGNGFYGEYDGENEIIKQLNSNGDFRSAECIEFLKECDVVVTNPPFSLFREYVAQLMEYGKKFIIIGNMNAITYKEIFPYIKNNELWVGYGFNVSYVYKTPYKNELEANAKFVKSKGYNPEDGYVKVPAVAWYTNIEYSRINTALALSKTFSPNVYPKYDNYDAIEVSKVSEIPMDYEGVMGVPITFLDKYCPTQFKIIDGVNHYMILDSFGINDRIKSEKGHCCNISGQAKYFRILIKRLS